MDEALKRQGSTLPPIAEHLVKSEADYKPLLDCCRLSRSMPGSQRTTASFALARARRAIPQFLGTWPPARCKPCCVTFLTQRFSFLPKTNLRALLELARPLETLLLEIAACAVACAPEPMYCGEATMTACSPSRRFLEATSCLS